MTGVAASSCVSDASAHAPAKPPSAPGTPSLSAVGQWTLPNLWCERALTAPVATVATLTEAEATAGAMPRPRRKVMVIVPKPMPRLPSTSWAAKPATPEMMAVISTGGLPTVSSVLPIVHLTSRTCQLSSTGRDVAPGRREA